MVRDMYMYDDVSTVCVSRACVQYLRFLEDISVVLKMESIHVDVGVENMLASIMARVQQLVGKEGDMLVDRKTHIYNLQRKIKSLKEQLDSKELHMDLLRKKVRRWSTSAVKKCFASH